MHPLICFPHRGIQIPFAIPTNSPWPLSLSLSPRTSFPISLPDAASRPFQILLCPRTKAAQMWGELALGTLNSTIILSQQDGGRFSRGPEAEKGGGVKKRKERLKAEKEGRQNKPLKSERKCMSEISIRKHSRGQRGGSWENKNKRAKCAGVGGWGKRLKHHRSLSKG